MPDFRDIAKWFEEFEMQLIQSLKRNLGRHESEEKAQDMEWSMWQAEKLKGINKFRRECTAIMNDYKDVIDEGTQQLLKKEFEQSASTDQPQFFGVDRTKLNRLIDDTVNLEKHAETAALRTVDDVYRQTIVRAQLALSSGTVTINQAVDIAVKDFLNKGINCIEYRDGRRVNIADYVRMALRTTATRAALQGKSERFKALGYDTIQVSKYSMCSDTCLPWQGRVYINDVYTMWDGEVRDHGGILWGKSNYCGKWFMLLSAAIEKGLFHPNCRHTILLWRDGDPLPESIDNEENERRYKLEQEQRRLENKVRKAKRKVEGLSDPDNIKKAKAELREAQKQLREFIDKVNADEGETILKRDYGKEKVYKGEVENKADDLPKWLTYVDGNGKIDLVKFKQELDNGQVNTIIEKKQQVKHQSSPQWRNQVKQALRSSKETPKSLLFKSIDPRLIVDQYGGTGILQSRKNNKCVDEYVTLPYEAGTTFDRSLGKYVKTNRVQIKYTKNGVHVFPIKEGGKK